MFIFFAKTRLVIQAGLNSGKRIEQSSLHAALHMNWIPPPKPSGRQQTMEFNSPVFKHLPQTLTLEPQYLKNKKII